MESKNRTLWIVVAVVLLLLCCCVVVVAAAAAWFVVGPTPVDVGRGWPGARVTERQEYSFPVDPAPVLEVDNFAGDVDIQVGAEGQIIVVAIKRAGSRGALNDVEVSVVPVTEGVRIKARAPGPRLSVEYVNLEITVPPATRIDVENGAGEIRIVGVRGEIQAHTGAGDVNVRGAEGPARLDTGAGSIDYEGRPRGDCVMSTGAGEIQVRLPTDVNLQLDLDTGIGEVQVQGFDVQGQVSSTRVQGTIGTGADGSLDAHTGAGSIDLMQQ